MTQDPIAFLHEVLPAHFAKGVASLRAAAGPGSKEALDDVLASKGAVRFSIDGEGETYLVVEDGAMRAEKTRPEGYVVRMAFGFTGVAARGALALLTESGRMDEPEAAGRFTRVASARSEKLLQGQKLEFHVIIKDVPDAADVVVKIGIGTDTAPEKPQFTAAISYDDLEDMREGDITPQQVLGRLRLTGDASRAMALGMMFMQPPPKK